MPTCPKCLKKTKSMEFCPHCGTSLIQSKPITTSIVSPGNQPASMSVSSIILIVLITIIIIGILAVIGIGSLGAFLVYLGIQAESTNVPTTLSMDLPDTIITNTTVAISAVLIDSNKKPVSNKTIIFDNGIKSKALTDTQGVARSYMTFNETAKYFVVVKFEGDKQYLSSYDSKNVTISKPSCSDYTSVGLCSSTNIGYICAQNKSLVFDCSSCGCTSGLVCYGNYCMTEEQKSGWVIQELQQSVVYVAHDYATGSAVIISQDEDRTYLLTNKHVIKDAQSITSVKITTRDQQTISVEDILVAPFDMDLAIISVLGTYGKPAKINLSASIYQGESVVAIGSPLGIQGSVSNGIISNLVYYSTLSSYKYDALQTDAAINPGNSGGGLFLKSTGELIGINTFVLPSSYGAEGLGFAIDVRSIDKLPSPKNWKRFVPSPKCTDGTPFSSCSIKNTGLFCSSGTLVNDCSSCGCAKGSYCPSSGVCFSCSAGYSGFETRGGTGFCCPTNWKFYQDSNDLPFCCPQGTVGYEGGTCR
ncbi:MAG: trypsin-like peptidase domain-containing protein [Candidatus Micrarchaeota archaeon]